MELVRKELKFDKYKNTTFLEQKIISIENVCVFDKEEVMLQTFLEVVTEDFNERFYYNSNHHDFNSVEADDLSWIIGYEVIKFDFNK